MNSKSLVPSKLAIAAVLSLSTLTAIAAEPVKIGLLEDQSGNFAIAVNVDSESTAAIASLLGTRDGRSSSPTTTRSRTTRASRSSRAA
jgi:urea transport system substrate-binding protein